MRRQVGDRGPALGDRGSGSVLVLAIIAAVAIVATVLLSASAALAARAQVAGAADLAALAAADVAVGRAPGIPCEAADRLARANGAAVLDCRVDGLVVTVRVSVPTALGAASAAATAGPPGGGRERRGGHPTAPIATPPVRRGAGEPPMDCVYGVPDAPDHDPRPQE